MKRIDARLDEQFVSEFEAVMAERLWSANKAINYIVKKYFTDEQKSRFYEEEINKKQREIEELKDQLDKSKDKPAVKKRAPAVRFVKPTWEEVASYFHEKGSITCQDDATRFIDFYTANGWKVGKNAMKDWKATVRTWMKRKDDDKQSGSKAISGNTNRAGYDRDSTDW